MQEELALDRQRLVEGFRKEIANVQQLFKGEVQDVKRDFVDEIKEIQKKVARHKTDGDLAL